MAGRRLDAFRLLGVTVALSASALMLVSSQLPWIHTTSPVAFDYWIDIHVDSSGGLDTNAIRVLVIAAIAVAALAVMSLVPYLRFLCAAVVVIGGVCIALALGVVSEINRPVANDILAPLVSQVHQRSPGTGVYVLIAGSTLAIISGALTLLAPRTAPPRYRYEYGPALYGAPGVLATAPYWPRERAGQDAAPTSRTSRRPPLGRRAPRSRSSGPRVPGHGRRPR